MAIYRTAQGKSLDMSALASRNERTRAVGNMSVNARGDTIDSQGKVVLPVTKKVGNKYQNTVANKAATIAKRKQQSIKPIETAPAPETKVDLTELVEEELEFADTTEEDLEIEAIKSQETTQDFVIKSADEAPDFFDPSNDVTTPKKK